MGLLTLGTPLSWSEAKKHADLVRERGIAQFLAIYRQVKDRKEDSLLWGDEIEYMVLDVESSSSSSDSNAGGGRSASVRSGKVRVALRAEQVLKQLREKAMKDESLNMVWSPEYARYMLESTPGKPYGPNITDLLEMEENMTRRRKFAESLLLPHERLMTLTSFPMLGTRDFYKHASNSSATASEDDNPASMSIFIPDDCINTHARFKTLTRNIRHRRGKKVEINIPIYKDKATPTPFVEKFEETAPLFNVGDTSTLKNGLSSSEAASAAKPDHVYMDCMCFGMGCCCLQVTFQAWNLTEARILYDQLAVISPIMLALTAASPLQRGYVTAHDCRWNIISASVDDRTSEELGITTPSTNSNSNPANSNSSTTKTRRIYKSRYDSIDSYLADATISPHFKEAYNDIELVVDESVRAKLLEEGVEPAIASHIAHLFIRDPLVIFSETLKPLEGGVETSVEHFENIQSTNWQTMRFKPPPLNSSIGWRIEFRSMEVQLTDFENSAFAAFIVLLSRAILKFNLNFYLPISKVDLNLQRAQKASAVTEQKFWFRRDINSRKKRKTNTNSDGDARNGDKLPEYLELTLDEILNGNEMFDGLLCHIYRYLKETVGTDALVRFEPYLSLIKKRASGKLMTMAKWQRSFVKNHPAYQQDSRLNDQIILDFLHACDNLVGGVEAVPEFLEATSFAQAAASSPRLKKYYRQGSFAGKLSMIDGNFGGSDNGNDNGGEGGGFGDDEFTASSFEDFCGCGVAEVEPVLTRANLSHEGNER